MASRAKSSSTQQLKRVAPLKTVAARRREVQQVSRVLGRELAGERGRRVQQVLVTLSSPTGLARQLAAAQHELAAADAQHVVDQQAINQARVERDRRAEALRQSLLCVRDLVRAVDPCGEKMVFGGEAWPKTLAAQVQFGHRVQAGLAEGYVGEAARVAGVALDHELLARSLDDPLADLAAALEGLPRARAGASSSLVERQELMRRTEQQLGLAKLFLRLVRELTRHEHYPAPPTEADDPPSTPASAASPVDTRRRRSRRTGSRRSSGRRRPLTP